MTLELSPTRQAVLGLLGKNLFGREYELPEDTDIPDLLRECRLQAVTGVALSKLNIREEPILTKAVYSAILKNNAVFNDHAGLHRMLTENGIPYVILKGASSAHYYPEPLLRMMGDVDFLVKPEDMDRVQELLLADGYELQGETHSFHRTFVKGKAHLEAHFAFAEKINPEIDHRIGEYLSDAIDEAQCVSDKHCTCRMPDRFRHGLILLLHMQRHMLAEGLGLRHLCDWAVFAASFSEEEFCSVFREKLEKIGLWRFAQIISLTAHLGLGLPYAAFMGEEHAAAEELLEDILTSGNFGRADEGRVNGRFFLERKAEADTGRTRIGAFIRHVNGIIVSHWPAAAESVLLLLLGWLFFSVRRIILLLLGKRSSLSLAKVYKKSASRKELYDKLHLFET